MSKYNFKSAFDLKNFSEKSIYLLNIFHTEREKWDKEKQEKYKSKHNEEWLKPDELKQCSNIDTSRSHLNKRWDNPNKMIITDEIREQCRKNRTLQKKSKIYSGAITTFRLEDDKGNNKTIKEYSKKDFQDVYKWADEQVQAIKDNPIWEDRFQFAELHLDETNPHIHFYFLNYNQEQQKMDTCHFWNTYEYSHNEINPFEELRKQINSSNQKFINSKTNNTYSLIQDKEPIKYFKNVKQLKLAGPNYKNKKMTKKEIAIKRQFQENCKYNCRIRKENKELREEQKELLKKQDSLKIENDNLLKGQKEQQKYISNFKEQNKVLENEINLKNYQIEYLDEIIKNQQFEIKNNDDLINYKEHHEEILNKLSDESYEEYMELQQQLLNNQNNNQGGQNG